MDAMKFPPDMVARVRSTMDRIGYCFLNSEEIQRLLSHAPAGRRARHQALEEFAEICGAEVETTVHLKSARFAPPTTHRDTVQGAEDARGSAMA